MKKIYSSILSLCTALFVAPKASLATTQNIYEMSFTDNRGKVHHLSEYKGKVLLMTNTASKCGFTKQLKPLQELYSRYKDRGFVVLGFPSDSFFQEMAKDAEVANFCELNFGIKFPMSTIVKVRGDEIDPIFRHLTTGGPKKTTGSIKWNFTKFLVDRNGNIIDRFSPTTSPDEPEVVKAIEKLL